MPLKRLLLLLLTLTLLPGCAQLGWTMSGDDDSASASAATPPASRSGRSGGGDDGPKPYDEVVTDEAETDEGIITIHQLDDGAKLLFEVPDSLLGRDLLMVSRQARTPEGAGYGGTKVNTQVIRWEKRGDRLVLRTVQYNVVADSTLPVYEAVQNSTLEPIIGSFDIEAYSEDETAAVIDVTPLFTGDVPLLGISRGARQQFQIRRLDPNRTFLEEANAYPENVEVRVLLTYDAQRPPSNPSSGTVSVEMNHSIVMLPSDPMVPRLADPRVGYFSVQQTDYGLPTSRAEPRSYITRWRMEPSDPEAYMRGELVDPVKPIVYYVDPATPEEWREYLIQGVDDWQVAFEAAGFSNAIRGELPPEDDPEFSPEDVRYSVIRYFASPVQNAFGPHVHDPRTGEILESDIGWFHNIQNLLRNWFFVQTAAVNPTARSAVFSPEVMGPLVRFVSAHEVGHTLGLPHNFISSAAVPVDSLRSPTYTARNGTAPSIMDYARFNYVAQPEDGVTQLYPQVGPYDMWSIEWGYRWFPGITSPDAEEPLLDAMILEKAGDLTYAFGQQTFNPIDPRSNREDLGDDAVYASELGVANLRRILPNITRWTARPGDEYATTEELYGQVVAQFNRYAGHVVANIGGVYTDLKTADQAGPVYTPVPPTQQRRALGFLHDYVFETPDWLLHEPTLRRIEPAGAIERIRAMQNGVLGQLTDPSRIARLNEAEVVDASNFGAVDLFENLRDELFAEVRQGRSIDPFRRTVQRAYVERLESLMTSEQNVGNVPAQFRDLVGITPIDVSQSDIRPIVRGELMALQSLAASAQRRYRAGSLERLHLMDLEERIEMILNPEG